jgi:hypothetical protein
MAGNLIESSSPGIVISEKKFTNCECGLAAPRVDWVTKSDSHRGANKSVALLLMFQYGSQSIGGGRLT